MSRIGKKEITIPAGVTVDVKDNHVIIVKGPKGELDFNYSSNMTIEINDNILTVKRPDDSKQNRTLHGTTRALINNMIVGVSTGFEKKLEINGVGYRCQLQGNKLNLSLGKSHPEIVEIPKELTVEVPKNTEIIIKGADKQLVGEFAANIRKLRAPEPYKGKGIKYAGERIRRKEGKTAK